MAKKKNDDGTSAFPKKWSSKLGEEWMKAADSKSTDELKKNIIQYEQAISSTEKDMEADPTLNGLKDKISEMKDDLKDKSAVYKETIVSSVAQIKYAVHLLDTRGVQVK